MSLSINRETLTNHRSRRISPRTKDYNLTTEQAAKREPVIASLQREIPDKFFDSPENNSPAGIEAVKACQTLFFDKGFDIESCLSFAKHNKLGEFFTMLMLREAGMERGVYFYLNQWMEYALLEQLQHPEEINPSYFGTQEENKVISGSISQRTDKNILRNDKRINYAGHGATSMFNFGYMFRRYEYVELFQNTRVGIIGGGPGGICSARALINMGFAPKNITVFDAHGKYGGTWLNKNVSGGSKNNPLPISFFGINLSAAPGPGSSINEFLDTIVEKGVFEHPLPAPIKANVLKIEPGDLNHLVTYQTSQGSIASESFPILINAAGIGKPLHPSSPLDDCMTTDTPHETGKRWQTIITPQMAERYRNKRLIFIGLGNSTAEMLIQLKRFNDKGYNIDYRVITHYPAEAVNNPERSVEKHGKTYRVFRDLTIPVLTRWEGDLPEAREAYFTAQRNGKIISDVRTWHSENNIFSCKSIQGSNTEIFSFLYKDIFTLIGNGHHPETLNNMGFSVTNPYLGSIAYDFDCDVQSNPTETGRERIYPGYYAIGALLKTELNPNAPVIPGMINSMYPMCYSIGLRTIEHKYK